MKRLILIALLVALIVSCSEHNDKSDAYGNFEADETIISAEANGKIMEFTIEEGQKLIPSENIGYIDTLQLYLKKRQVLAQKNTLKTKFSSIFAQVDVLKEQKAVAMKNYERIKKMLEDKAATEQQVDDIKGKIDVINKQIIQVETQNATVINEMETIET